MHQPSLVVDSQFGALGLRKWVICRQMIRQRLLISPCCRRYLRHN